MTIIWSDSAIEDIDDIVTYISHDNPSAAKKLVDHMFDAVHTVLISNPLLGRPGRVTDSRELIVHSSYIVAYRICEENVEILSVRHTSQLWPEKF